jgi:hypothetical protein
MLVLAVLEVLEEEIHRVQVELAALAVMLGLVVMAHQPIVELDSMARVAEVVVAVYQLVPLIGVAAAAVA